MKKILTLFLAFMLIISMLPSVYAADIQLKLNITCEEQNLIRVSEGDTITVKYTIENMSSDAPFMVSAASNDIFYDNSFFDFVKGSIVSGINGQDTKVVSSSGGDYMVRCDKKEIPRPKEYQPNTFVGSFDLTVKGKNGTLSVISSDRDIMGVFYGDKPYNITANDLTVVVGDVELFDVTYKDGDKTISTAKAVAGKIKVASAPKSTPSGYQFDGWTAGGITYQPGDEYELSANTVFTAKWSKTGGNDNGGMGGSTGSGGGGISAVDKTKNYTKDMFGNEHPTHIGYINGYPDGSVKPDGNITREEVTSILYRVKYREYTEPFVVTDNVFPDVESSRWSAPDIEFMAKENIIAGYPDGEFKPQRNLTRAEFAALIRRFTDLNKPSEQNVFTDLKKSHWAYNDILILTEAGLLKGYEDNTICAEKEITRAEVMTVINKILGRCPDDTYVKSLEFKPFNDLNKEKWYYTAVLEATVTHDYVLNSKKNLETKWENWK